MGIFWAPIRSTFKLVKDKCDISEFKTRGTLKKTDSITKYNVVRSFIICACLKTGFVLLHYKFQMCKNINSLDGCWSFFRRSCSAVFFGEIFVRSVNFHAPLFISERSFMGDTGNRQKQINETISNPFKIYLRI